MSLLRDMKLVSRDIVFCSTTNMYQCLETASITVLIIFSIWIQLMPVCLFLSLSCFCKSSICQNSIDLNFFGFKEAIFGSFVYRCDFWKRFSLITYFSNIFWMKIRRMVPLSLTKLMVSHDLPRSTVTNQIAFDQRDLYSFLNSNAR